MLLTAAGLLLRALLICGWVRLEISDRVATRATIAYSAFYVVDYLALSREFLAATVHLVFFLAVVKVLTAKTSRDHLYTAVIAFLELVAAAILSVNFNFFLFLARVPAVRHGGADQRRDPPLHEPRRRRVHGALRTETLPSPPRGASVSVTLGILAITAGLFFILPRTADAAFSRLISHRLHLPGFSNQVNLGEIGEIKTTSRPVMHIRLWGNQQGLKWRAGALTDFDGKRWSNPNPMREPVRVLGRRGASWRRSPTGPPAGA